MRTEEIYAGTIEDAAEKILQALEEDESTTRSVSSRDNVLYFDGWDGLGASAVLRAVARRLATPTSPARQQAGLQFDQVIHVDCSMWESRRALQRAVAEQLQLPDEVMELFDKEDEEDDFRGVAQGSRAELQQVIREMQRHIQKHDRRFLVVFHNGSSEEVDLASLCGFPLSGFSSSKVLWTFQGRFRLKPRVEVDAAIKSAGTTDAFVSINLRDAEVWSNLVRQEAEQVAEACKATTGQVTRCVMYMLELCCRGCQTDLGTHAANYLVCDGIIQQLQQEQRYLRADDFNMDWLWRAADALQREMPLDVDYWPSLHLSMCVHSKPCWISPGYGFNRIPDGAIPNGDMLQRYADKLCVLKLSRCTFDFQSPPFLCCHSLRFLWLDHCQGARTTGAADDGVGKEEEGVRRCFQRLWVLDVRYMDCDQILSAQMMDLMTQLRELNVKGAQDFWDIGQLRGRLPNVRKLRVTDCEVRCSDSENNLFSERTKMELLDFSGNSIRSPGMSISNSSCCLETVVIVDGCYVHGIEHISFRGCTGLKNIILRGPMYNLRTLDISGTAVKTLDLSTAEIYVFDELYLLGREKLRAILWPPEERMKPDLARLFIDTMQSSATIAQPREEEKDKGGTSASATTGASAAAPHGSRPTSEFGWHISVRDARLLWTLWPVYSSSREAYVEVSSIAAGGSKDEGIKSGGSEQPAVYEDIMVDHLQQQDSEGGGGDALGITSMQPCPDVPRLPEKEKSCYIHLHDRVKTDDLQRGGDGTTGIIRVPRFLADCGKILHVHDSMSVTCTPSFEWGSDWPKLEWCRIERCPKLDCVFDRPPAFGPIYDLRTFWASHLIKARYIWTSGVARAFPHLMFLHLDLCPRLIHVLPLATWKGEKDSLHLLENLEIAWCGDLREIFPFQSGDLRGIFPFKRRIGDDDPIIITRDFPSLKRIRLHELPSLQGICGVRVRMHAPNLETVRIRGCWRLTRLPDVSGGSKAVECDCEKEWWDRLEWEDASHAARYRPVHPRHYKKTALRGTVLR